MSAEHLPHAFSLHPRPARGLPPIQRGPSDGQSTFGRTPGTLGRTPSASGRSGSGRAVDARSGSGRPDRKSVVRSISGALTGPASSSAAVSSDALEVFNHVVHEAFRRDLRRLAETLREQIGPQRRTAISNHIRFLVAELSHHHTVEDTLIWPRAVRRDPELADVCRQMAREHARLGWVVARLTKAVDAWHNDAARAAVQGAVIDLEKVLEPHLQHEETAAMPVICGVMTGIDRARINQKLRRWGTPSKMAARLLWLVDDLDARQAAMVQSIYPTPVRRALKLRYSVAWHRRQTLLWG